MGPPSSSWSDRAAQASAFGRSQGGACCAKVAEGWRQFPPAAEHPPLQTLVQRLLAQLQTTDGAFMDTPMLGPCVGSGFALEIARALSD